MDENPGLAGLSRRDVLKRFGWGGLALCAGAAGAPLLSACGSSGSGDGKAGGSAAFSFQLGWIPDAEYAGYFVADEQGDYSRAKIRPNVLAGGPNIDVEPVVVAGKALVGVETVPENVAHAVLQGADLRIVGALFQKSPECWVSLAKNPIKEPKDIEGKRLGITLAGKATALKFMAKNNVDPSKVKLVPIQFDPAPLVAGEIDALWGLVTNQPVELAQRGIKTTSMLLADYGFNRMQDVLITTGATLSNKAKAAQLREFVAAARKGWEAALADPSHAAQVVITRYGKKFGLTAESQRLQVEAMAPFVKPSGGTEIFSMSDALISETTTSLNNIVGVKAKSSLFTDELL